MKAVKSAALAILILAALLASPYLAGGTRDYAPYPADAPWPVMRGNLKNTGYARFMDYTPSPDAATQPVRFKTGNGIFSTPVIDGQERVYVGSADHYFYAADPAADKVVWKFDARELIDSAAALSAGGRVYVPAGAGLYALDMQGEKIWTFDVTNNRPKGLYTFGTNYWWEGNVVVGPEGNLYAGNNDFFFYSIDPSGKMRWAHRTGFLIWTVPAFDDNGTLYFAGFDMRLYALDRNTGKLKWKTNLKNPLVASPALGPDGTIYQGSFGGKVFALDPARGKIKWSYETDSHVYGSAAVAPDNKVYVTSTDGFLYAFEGETGKVRWSFYTGDAVRSSPVLGPDPEKKEDYLIYFGGGQGNLFALQPDGQRRWSYDTLTLTGPVDYPNLNASPALGKYGIAIANANGDIFYVPYNYYTSPDAKGITTDPTDGFHEDGAHWHLVSPGGLIDKTPVSSSGGDAVSVHPQQIAVLRLIVRKDGVTTHAKLKPGTLRTVATPDFKHRVEPIGDEKTVIVIPEEMLEPGGEYKVEVSAEYEGEGSGSGTVKGTLALEVEEPKSTVSFSPGQGYEFTHMAFPQPPIVPSLDQIGIAIMKIPFAVIDSDPEKKTFVAWSVQKYGAAAGGEEEGIPDSRSLFYAFSGKWEGDFFTIESDNCFFEESSFPFPLDVLRYSGRLRPDGTAEKGASLLAELDPPSIIKALGILSVSSEEQSSGRQSWVKGSLSGGGMKGFAQAARVSGPTVAGYISNHIWRPWDLYNSKGIFEATGTFRMARLPQRETDEPAGLSVKKFEYLPRKRQVIAEVGAEGREADFAAIAIVLVDNTTGKPVALNYNLALSRQRLEDGTKRTVLEIEDKKLLSGDMTAYLMADLYPLAKLEIAK